VIRQRRKVALPDRAGTAQPMSERGIGGLVVTERGWLAAISLEPCRGR
jgi:hypothetical protein